MQYLVLIMLYSSAKVLRSETGNSLSTLSVVVGRETFGRFLVEKLSQSHGRISSI